MESGPPRMDRTTWNRGWLGCLSASVVDSGCRKGSKSLSKSVDVVGPAIREIAYLLLRIITTCTQISALTGLVESRFPWMAAMDRYIYMHVYRIIRLDRAPQFATRTMC